MEPQTPPPRKMQRLQEQPETQQVKPMTITLHLKEIPHVLLHISFYPTILGVQNKSKKDRVGIRIYYYAKLERHLLKVLALQR